MKFYHLLFLFILFCSCSRNREVHRSNPVLPSQEKRNEEVLTKFKETDTLGWHTITGIIDTVKHYQLNLQPWPEEAIAHYLDEFWKNHELPPIGKQVSAPLQSFMEDTMRVKHFRDFIPREGRSSWDEIYIGDFEMLNFQYLNKKYTRLLRTMKKDDPMIESIRQAQPLWDAFYDGIKISVDSILLGPHPYLMREVDKLKLLRDINEWRLHSLADFYLLLADPDYEITPRGKEITLEDINGIQAVLMDHFSHPSQRQVLRMIHERWNGWITCRYELYHHLTDPREKRKYGLHLQNILNIQYVYYEGMLETGYTYTRTKSKDDPRSGYRPW